MVNQIFVSVCMITYNHENHIKEAIESVLKQTCNFKVELIIANDCSTDSTDKVVSEIINKNISDVTINYINHKKNLGMMSNFVFALEKCQGKYIALLDGDDYWTDPLKLQKQVDFLEGNEEYSVCFHLCEVLNIKNNGKIDKQRISAIKYEYTVYSLLTLWGIPTASIIFRNDRLKKEFPAWFIEIASGDIALLMMLFETGKFKLLEEYMSVYRVNGQGVSNTHLNYRMIHYRAKLYYHLNEYFNYKYEKEIYDALNYIYHEFSQKEDKVTKVKNNQGIVHRIITKLKK